MGDLSEIRGLIFCLSFLGIAILLIGWIPAQFYALGDFRQVEVPDVFEAIDVYAYADTASNTFNETGGFVPPLDPTWYMVAVDDDGVGDPEIGGHTVDIKYKRANETEHKVKYKHYYAPFIIVLVHDMYFYDKSGINLGQTLDVQDMEDNRESSNDTSRFKVKCEHFSMDVFFGYNSTLYGNFTQAWDFHGIEVLHGINFDQVSTSYNAFDLIAKLIFFQLPFVETHVNAILNIPIYGAVAYLVYIFILKTIGAIFAGG